MKTFPRAMMVAVVASISLLAPAAFAQDSTAAPQLSSTAADILRMAKANVGDDTIVAYIKNSGHYYTLNADQIIYLKQQGVSSTVLNTMLTQPRATYTDTTVATAPAPAVAPAPVYEAPTPAPEVTYVQTPNTYYYYSAPYYYPIGYSYYNYWYRPGVSFSLGFGERFGGRFGGGFHREFGGFRGGVIGAPHGGFGGGGFHGGAGGFHGGGGGFHGGFHR